PRDLARLARGRPLPRREHPRLRRALAAAEAAERLPRGRVRRCGRAPAEPWRLRRRLGPAATAVTVARPAFYALAPGGWRDYLTLLHPPYTAWHLSYVCVGAALVPTMSWTRLGASLAAFALAMGVGAHALDELRGRPLQTRIPDTTLWILAAGSITAAVAIGIYA